MADPARVKAFLDQLTTSNRVRKAAWDALSAPTDVEVRQRLDALPLTTEAKRSLWDAAMAESSAADAPPAGTGGQPAPDINALSMFDVPRQAVIGALKSVPRAAVGAGQMVAAIPGVSQAIDAAYRLFGVDVDTKQSLKDAMLQPEMTYSTPAEQAGGFVGDVAQFAALPSGKVRAARALPRLVRGGVQMVRQGFGAGVLTGAQGGDPRVGAVAGAASPVLAKGTEAAVNWVGGLAVPLVRSGLKTLVSEMSKVPGASRAGVNRKANELARFIIDKRITSANKAERIIADAESEVQALLDQTPTDAPARALRYLGALERSAAKQGLPAADVAAIRSHAAELLTGPHGETVMAPVAASRMVNAAGLPVTPRRVLRSDMPADEAMGTARATSRWKNRKQWGEQKGASIEASKAVERADRDAVKAAIPGTRDPLHREAMGIQAKKAFTRSEFRQANREPLGMPTAIAGAVELTHGRLPIMAMATEFLRQNEVRMGIWADRLATALKRNDVETVATILNRFGVGSTAQASK